MQTTPARIDRLIVDESVAEGAASRDLVVLDDPDGSLTSAALDLSSDRGGRVAVWTRDVRQARDLAALAADRRERDRVVIAGIDGPLDGVAFLAGALPPGARLAMTRLPKSLAELDHLAGTLAASNSDLTLVAGGRTAHMTRSQNDVLGRSFAQVRASLGQGKFRALVASAPRPDAVAPAPSSSIGEHGTVHGIGGVFGGAEPDRGGSLMLDAALADLTRSPHPSPTMLDLGCGNGSVALAVLDALPAAHVIATDVATDAVLSAQRTLSPAGDRATVTWDDAASTVADASVDVVLLNPPFHEGTRIDATLVNPLLDAARRVLRPGGVLYLVHNSHLRYRPAVQARFAQVTQSARDRTFTVLRAERH